MVGHGGSSAGSYLADPTSPIPSHCASIVVTSTLRVNYVAYTAISAWQFAALRQVRKNLLLSPIDIIIHWLLETFVIDHTC